MPADAAIVQAATWTAGAAAAYLALRAAGAAWQARRGAVRALLGGGLAAVVASGGVALAAPDDGRSPHPPAVSVDWPGAARPGARPVVVRPGDCLWLIAARRLDHPSTMRIAVAWPRWWRANQRVVGRNPNLIQPGQRLRPPVTVRSRS